MSDADGRPATSPFPIKTSPPPIRWWPAVALTGLASVLLAAVWLREAVDQQRQVVTTLVVGIFFALGLILWLVFFSRLRPRLRGGIALGSLAATLLFFTFFRVQGVSGNFIPILSPRFGGGPRLAAQSTTAKVDIATSPNDFPQFRGPARDGRVEGVRLGRDWVTHPPHELWRRPVGSGWSGFAVVGQLAITQEQREDQEVVTAYDLVSGEPRWSHAAPGFFENTLGGDGPRATPTVEGGEVFTFGPTGLLRALELSTGRLLWSRQAAEENGGKRPEWGYAGSPLLVGELVVVTVGGEAGQSLVAYHRKSGDKAWSGGSDRAGFSSPQLASLDGHQQILIFNQSSVAGHDPQDGRLLWSFPWSAKQPNVAQPVLLTDHSLLVSSGYGVGSARLEVRRAGASWTVQELWQNNQMKAKFSNLVRHGGKIYGLDDGIFACLDPESGQRCWKEGRYGHGQMLLVGDLLLLLSESGELVLIEPNPAGLAELARFPVLSGKTWNTFALSGNKLLVRNSQEAACFELPLAG